MEYPPFFNVCFERLIGHEGGYSDDRRDPGNWTGGRPNVGTLLGTKFGIAANTYPDIDIKNLTLEQAKAIYYRDWWLKLGADFLSNDMVYQVWQFAVNAGMGNARRVLQRAAGVVADGKIGPLTRSAILAMDKRDLMLLWFKFIIQHYTSLSTWPTYGKGWMNRTASALDYASKDN